MPDFKKNFHSGNSRRPHSSGGNSFGPRGRSFEKKELYDAECNKCHKQTQVPFRPNGTKPVYCRDCFVPEAANDRAPRFERRAGPGRADFTPRPEKDARIDDIIRRLDSMERTLEKLSDMLQATTRKEALAQEVRKHAPEEAKASSKKIVKKKAAKIAKAK